MGSTLRRGLAASLVAACDLLAGARVSERSVDDTLGLDQLPPAVRATLERETRGRRILTVTRAVDRDAAIYVARLRRGGSCRLVAVAADGRLVHRV
jgi:hypothetical protein